MQDQPGTPDECDTEPRSGFGNAKPGSTRRSFLKDIGKKALYVTPVVMTLTAQAARAQVGTGSCIPEGSDCIEGEDWQCCDFIDMMGNPQTGTCTDMMGDGDFVCL